VTAETTKTFYMPNLCKTVRNRDSAVGIATGYGLDDREVEAPVPVGSRWEKVDPYIHSPIRLHGVVLNWLSTGTALPLP
jgi:hypothetical protein